MRARPRAGLRSASPWSRLCFAVENLRTTRRGGQRSSRSGAVERPPRETLATRVTSRSGCTRCHTQDDLTRSHAPSTPRTTRTERASVSPDVTPGLAGPIRGDPMTRLLSKLALALLAVALAVAPARGQDRTLTILSVNDTHSNLDASGPKDASLDGTVGGLVKASGVIARLRATE